MGDFVVVDKMCKIFNGSTFAKNWNMDLQKQKKKNIKSAQYRHNSEESSRCSAVTLVETVKEFVNKLLNYVQSVKSKQRASLLCSYSTTATQSKR